MSILPRCENISPRCVLPTNKREKEKLYPDISERVGNEDVEESFSVIIYERAAK